MTKNKQSNLIASVKMLNIGFAYKYILNSGIVGGYSVSVSYQSLLSNLFPLALLPAPPPPPQLFFSIKYRRNKLLRVGFITL